MHRLGVDQVVVVEYKHHLALTGLGGQFVDQGGDQLIEGGWRRRAEQRFYPLGDLRLNLVQRGDHVPPKPRRVVVACV